MRIELIIRTLLILVFAFSAITKLNDIEAVYLHVNEVMPFIKVNALIEIVSFYIPLLELSICLALAFKTFRRTGYFISLILSTGFLIFILFLDSQQSCGCFGSALKISHTQSIILDIILIGLSILGLKFSKEKTALIKPVELPADQNA
ncbi:hypothetical protein PQO03_11880 [Lentisphaera profundi]|uniref:Methylamine utilisation protein MauE domain-containing protein n=1 Tax=Lentisphaera profundi TaxID=1658616 RepID=A0ABY7VWE0_9BACT|nr:MauE/DoxX family redox-associated membrane protein [Lentisphaera profundi]WDE98538.1 hypothetical protein PQO03_11880 [Lentisphaera profundi]